MYARSNKREGMGVGEVKAVDTEWQENIVKKDAGLTFPQSVFCLSNTLTETLAFFKQLIYEQVAHANNHLSYSPLK